MEMTEYKLAKMNYNTSHISTHEKIQLFNLLNKIEKVDMVEEIVAGLKANQMYLPSKFFYDTKGSMLFEEITKLEEYYPTRTEKAILKNIAPKIFNDLKDTDIVELGSGDGSKVSILLKAIREENLETIQYIPVDFSESAINKSIQTLSAEFPELSFVGFTADFLSQMHLIPRIQKRLICFMGSTLGNLNQADAQKFLGNVRASMNSGDGFLLGVDMLKNRDVLNRAYNDDKGVTADFNLNILKVSNQIAKTNFNIDDFEHLAFFNESKSRIEMHLKALHDVEIRSPYLLNSLTIKKGDTIHTENSNKYTLESIEHLLNTSNLSIKEVFTDRNNWFSVLHIIPMCVPKD
jgi:L-histidine Nalpha-methyltransferase